MVVSTASKNVREGVVDRLRLNYPSNGTSTLYDNDGGASEASEDAESEVKWHYGDLRRALKAIIIDAPQRNQWYLQLSSSELGELKEQIRFSFSHLSSALVEATEGFGIKQGSKNITLAARETLFLLIDAYAPLIQTDRTLGDALVECILPCYGLPMFAMAVSQCPPHESSPYNCLRDPSVSSKTAALAWSLPSDVTRRALAENMVRAVGKGISARLLKLALPAPSAGSSPIPGAHLGFFASMAIEAMAACRGKPDFEDSCVRTVLTSMGVIAKACGSNDRAVTRASVSIAQAIACAACASFTLQDDAVVELFELLVAFAMQVHMPSALQSMAVITSLQRVDERNDSCKRRVEAAISVLCGPESCEDLMEWWMVEMAGSANASSHAFGSLLLSGIASAAYASANDENRDQGYEIAADHFLGEMACSEGLAHHAANAFQSALRIVGDGSSSDELSAFVAVLGTVYPLQIDGELRRTSKPADPQLSIMRNALRGCIADYLDEDFTLLQASEMVESEPERSLEATKIIYQRHSDSLRGQPPAKDDDMVDRSAMNAAAMGVALSVLTNCKSQSHLWATLEHIGYVLKASPLQVFDHRRIVDALSEALHSWMNIAPPQRLQSVDDNADNNTVDSAQDKFAAVKAVLGMLCEAALASNDQDIIETALVSILPHCPQAGNEITIACGEAMRSLSQLAGHHPLLCAQCAPFEEDGEVQGGLSLAQSVALSMQQGHNERFNDIVAFLERVLAHSSTALSGRDESAKLRAVRLCTFMSSVLTSSFTAKPPKGDFALLNAGSQQQLLRVVMRMALHSELWRHVYASSQPGSADAFTDMLLRLQSIAIVSSPDRLSSAKCRELVSHLTSNVKDYSWTCIDVARARIEGQCKNMNEFVVELSVLITTLSLCSSTKVFARLSKKFVPSSENKFDMARTGRLVATIYSASKRHRIPATIRVRCLQIMSKALGSPDAEKAEAAQHVPQLFIASCLGNEKEGDRQAAQHALKLAVEKSEMGKVASVLDFAISTGTSLSDFVSALRRHAAGESSGQEKSRWMSVKPSDARKTLSYILNAAGDFAKTNKYGEAGDWECAASILKGVECSRATALDVDTSLRAKGKGKGKGGKSKSQTTGFVHDVVLPIAETLAEQYASYDMERDPRSAEARAMHPLLRFVSEHLASLPLKDPAVSNVVMKFLMQTGAGPDRIMRAHLFPQYTIIFCLDAKKCATELSQTSKTELVTEVSRILLGGSNVFDPTLQRTRCFCGSFPSVLMTMVAKCFEEGMKDFGNVDEVLTHLEAVRGLLESAVAADHEGSEAFLPLLIKVLCKTLESENLLSQAFTVQTTFSVATACISRLASTADRAPSLEIILQSAASTFLSKQVENSPQTRIAALEALRSVASACAEDSSKAKAKGKLRKVCVATIIEAFEVTSTMSAQNAAEATYRRQLKSELAEFALTPLARLIAFESASSQQSSIQIMRRLIQSYDVSSQGPGKRLVKLAVAFTNEVGVDAQLIGSALFTVLLHGVSTGRAKGTLAWDRLYSMCHSLLKPFDVEVQFRAIECLVQVAEGIVDGSAGRGRGKVASVVKWALGATGADADVRSIIVKCSYVLAVRWAESPAMLSFVVKQAKQGPENQTFDLSDAIVQFASSHVTKNIKKSALLTAEDDAEGEDDEGDASDFNKAHRGLLIRLVSTLGELMPLPPFFEVVDAMVVDSTSAVRQLGLRLLDVRLARLGSGELAVEPSDILLMVRMFKDLVAQLKQKASEPVPELGKQQTTLLCLDMLCRCLGSAHAAHLLPSVDVLVRVLTADFDPSQSARNEYHAWRASACVALASLCKTCGTSIIPKVPRVVPGLLTLLETIARACLAGELAASKSDALELLLGAALGAVDIVVETVPGMLSPYLGELFSQTDSLRTAHASSDDVASRVRDVHASICAGVESRLVFRALLQMCQDLESGAGEKISGRRRAVTVVVPRVMETMLQVKEGEPVLVKYHEKMVEILVKVMESRQLVGIHASVGDLAAIEEAEILCAKCIATLSLSLHEAQMNSVFEKLSLWAGVKTSAVSKDAHEEDDEEEDEEVSVFAGSKRRRVEEVDEDALSLERVWKALPFYRTVSAIMEELRSMGGSYAWSVVKDMLQLTSLRMPFASSAADQGAEEQRVLKRARLNSEGSISDSLVTHLSAHYKFLTVVLEAFRLTVLHGGETWDGGNANEFQKIVVATTRPLRRKAFLDAVAPSLASNGSAVELHEAFVEASVAPAIALLAGACAMSDANLSILHTETLSCLHSSDASDRKMVLKTVNCIADELQERYLSLIPDSIPYIAEIMDDSDEAVRVLAHRFVHDMEKLSGENLQAYLS